MLELRLLDVLDLRASDGREYGRVLRQPKRAALLAYLACAHPRGFHRRDKLLALFWPEADEQSARNSLNTALSYLRHELGPGSLITRGDADVSLASSMIWCDVVGFEQALAQGQLEGAVALYRADLLDGFHLSDAPAFGEWLEAERNRLRREAAEAACALAERLAATGDAASAVAHARRAASLAPDDERTRRALIALLASVGDRLGALRAHEDFAAWLRTEFDTEPSAETQALVQAIRARDAITDIPPPDALASQPPTRAASALQPTGRNATGSPRTLVEPVVRSRHLRVFVAAFAGAAVAVGAWNLRPAETAPKRIRSLLVLPPENLTGDSAQDYFVAGLHDVLIAELGRISGLRTISRTSAIQAKASGKPLAKIARDLDVDAVVEGSALRAGDSVRLNLRLISPEDARQLWAEAFDSDMSNVLLLLKQATRAIAEQALTPLTSEERAQLARGRSVNPAAHDAYVRGVYHAESFTPAGLSKGIALLEDAIRGDPENPFPYAALARIYTYSGVGHGTAVARRAAFSQAKAAALKAIELDETSADAHASLGFVHLFHDWDWARADSEFRRAISLDPNSPSARWGRALYLTAIRNFDEALAENLVAQQLDPLSLIVMGEVAVRYYVAGRYNEAITWAEKALDLEPKFVPALWVLGVAYREKGSYPEAIKAHELAAAENPVFKSHLAITYARAGLPEAARRLLSELGGEAKRRAAFNVAQIHVALGERAEGLRWLEIAYDEHHPWFHWIRLEPALALIRSEPRYHALVRRLGLPEH